MSFTNGKPWTVTADDLKHEWGGLPNGEGFRCSLCGRKFATGDVARWQYSGGRGHINLLVCEPCDDTPERLSEKFFALLEEFHSDRFWVFRERRRG